MAYEDCQYHESGVITSSPYKDFRQFLVEQSQLANGDKYLYVPGTKFSDNDNPKDYNLFGNEYGNLDVTVFYNNVYFLTDEDLKNKVFTSSGVKITGSGYIAYDLTTLSGAIGGFSGKTIEIEFNALPEP